MQCLTVKLKTVIPLFLGGAGKADKPTAEMRVPSIKGALRFWFRFAEGARQQGDLKKVKDEEDRLFGSADKGTGVFRICLEGNPPIITKVANIPNQYKEWFLPIMYMGYGCISQRRLTDEEKRARNASNPRKPTTVFQPSRPFIDEGQSFSFQLIFGQHAKPSDDQKIYEAIWLWTHLGGFGSRARRGWGSLALESVTPVPPGTGFEPSSVTSGNQKQLQEEIKKGIEKIVTTDFRGVTGGVYQEEIKKGIEKIVGSTLPQTAEFTHWFAQSIVRVPHVANSWQEAMEWIGNKFIEYRSNFSGKKNGPHGMIKYPCRADHDLVRNYLLPPPSGYVPPPRAPMRVEFGLPNNYGYSKLKLNQNPYQATVKAQVGNVEIDRRASPLFIHFHIVQGGVAVVVTAVPSDFLPKTAEILFKPEYDKDRGSHRALPVSHDPPPIPVSLPSNYSTLNAFLRTL